MAALKSVESIKLGMRLRLSQFKGGTDPKDRMCHRAIKIVVGQVLTEFECTDKSTECQ